MQQVSTPIIVTRFNLKELQAIQANGELLESMDFGPCACGLLKQIVYVMPWPHTQDYYDHCTYSHGELLFKVSIYADEPGRQVAVDKLLQEIGCAAD